VDISLCTDSLSQGFQVTDIQDGEWLQYTVTVKEAGKYNIGFRTSAKDSIGAIRLVVNNNISSTPVILPATGSEQQWRTTVLKNVSLPKGINQLKIVVDKGGFGFHYILLQPVGKTAKAKTTKSKTS
jgi:hypothetical protein